MEQLDKVDSQEDSDLDSNITVSDHAFDEDLYGNGAPEIPTSIDNESPPLPPTVVRTEEDPIEMLKEWEQSI